MDTIKYVVNTTSHYTVDVPTSLSVEDREDFAIEAWVNGQVDFHNEDDPIASEY